MQISANLGFLWTELSLPEAVRAASKARFDAVELHWPYDVPAGELKIALQETGLPVLGLNTSRGDLTKGENGLAALPGRADEAQAAIDQAIQYADAINASAIHVMAGKAEGADAQRQFIENLEYATAQTSRTILIEPLNRHDAPGYFLNSLGLASKIIEAVAADNLKIMFDCYHTARTEGDVFTRFREHKSHVGHVQFAGVPSRGTPEIGEIDYSWLLPAMRDAGWQQPFGAEYKPGGKTEDSLGWLAAFRQL